MRLTDLRRRGTWALAVMAVAGLLLSALVGHGCGTEASCHEVSWHASAPSSDCSFCLALLGHAPAAAATPPPPVLEPSAAPRVPATAVLSAFLPGPPPGRGPPVSA